MPSQSPRKRRSLRRRVRRTYRRMKRRVASTYNSAKSKSKSTFDKVRNYFKTPKGKRTAKILGLTAVAGALGYIGYKNRGKLQKMKSKMM